VDTSNSGTGQSLYVDCEDGPVALQDETVQAGVSDLSVEVVSADQVSVVVDSQGNTNASTLWWTGTI